MFSEPEPTEKEIIEKAEEVKSDLGIDRDFESPCIRCPILYYWITEGCKPSEERLEHCSILMRKNIEFLCEFRPRDKNDDAIIGEGLSKWL